MKFSIVTASYNSEEHIAETIESVLSQEGAFEIEYLLQDGGSKDRTMEIIESYRARLERGDWPVRCSGITMHAVSEPDRGMYDAINKGFARATGDVYAWINSDDYYLPGAFTTAARVFETYPEAAWISGRTEVLNTDGSIEQTQRTIFVQSLLAQGAYGTVGPFVLQDSVFWRASLWKEAGPLDDSMRYAGDYLLWTKFAERAPLWAFDTAVSRFRRRPGQLSASMGKYRAEQKRAVPTRPLPVQAAKLYYWSRSRTPRALRPVLDALWPLLFPDAMRHYVHIAPDGTPERRPIRTPFL